MIPAQNSLFDLGFKTVKELETEDGIMASGKNELYGCIFGRDSLLTSLKLLQVYKQIKNEDCLRIVHKSLRTLSNLQGNEVNIESGEEPGKMIHEYRPTDHEHLTMHLDKPWYVYPDKVMRNYDTIDATPLFLITVYRYLQASDNTQFLKDNIGQVRRALEWILRFGDGNGDGLLDYGLKPERNFGGLLNQNWMDSVDSTFHEDGKVIKYPLAPLEAQAYAYMALRLWQTYYLQTDEEYAHLLGIRADQLKKLFNDSYVIYHDKFIFLASAIDGNGIPLKSIRSSIGHALWACLNKEDDGRIDGIVETAYIPKIVKRLFQKDLFEPHAGVRTLSTISRNFQPNSYHNGSIWPHDNSIIAEGLDNYGYHKEAAMVRKAVAKAISHFNTPIELFIYWNGQYSEYTELNGRTGSKKQAWTAASILADTLALSKTKQSFMESLATNSLLVMLLNEVSGQRTKKIVKAGIHMVSKNGPFSKIMSGR